ncbi:MAG TPA: C40 family peptidase [Ignavibacteriaceae bacterium]
MIHQSTAQVNAGDIPKIIEEIRTKYAADKRTAIFNINFTSEEKFVYLSGETNLPEAKKELLSLLEKSNVVDQIIMLPSVDLGTKIYGIVNLSVADVRTKPEHSAELATQVLLGSRLKILKSSGEWYLVQCEDDYIGWMDNDGVYLMDHEKFDEWNKTKKIIVTAPFTFSYSEGNVYSTPVSDVVQGNLLKFISRKEDFIKVEFPDERIAFILNDQVQDYEEWLDERNQSYDAINFTAHMMMGIPYVWGGTSIKGLDCSGFTKRVFQLNGVQLPRDASQQVHIGELVDTKNGFDNLMPGDLLFFGSIDHITGKEKISHVAIYLGNLEFIHASGRVRINSFDNTKSNFAEGRLKTFIKAKRVLGSLGRNDVKLIKDLNKNYK